jgi:predicted nucleic acid-binding protein
MVAFDAHFVMLALRPAIPASVDRAKDRVTNLVADLQKRGERILVPMPALTEFLVHAGTAGQSYLEELQKSSKFRLAPYGLRAAVEVASAIETAVKKGSKKDGSKSTWAKVNFDRQIAAIAKVEGADVLYTDDENLRKFADKLGLRVITLEEVPIPPSKTPLLDGLEEIDEPQKTIAGKTEDSPKLLTDGGRSTGDATGAPKASEAKKG